MKLLLDTHAFIWWYNAPQRLPQSVLQACENPNNLIALSVASIWEMQIKAQIGKLSFDKPIKRIIQRQQTRNQLQILPITMKTVLSLDDLPLHHRDPFDRLIVAQAREANLTLVSNDARMSQYEVSLLW